MLAQQPDETTQDFHVFPQIADGDGWQSFLLVTNVSQSASQCTFNLYGMDVDRFADISGITAAGSTATFDLEGLGDYLVWGTKNELSVTSGHGTLDCSAPVVAQVLYAFIDQLGETAGMATVFSSQAGAVFQFPILAQGELAFAVANDADSDAFCDFVLESPDRLNLGEATLPVPSKSKVARMLNEVIQVPAGFTGGSATVSCDQQVSVIGLQIDGTIFTTLPPAILSPTPNPSPEEHADLVVGSPSVNDNSPETEGSFTLSATVHNSGDGDAAATTLRYYRSTDATITRSDTQVGTDAVGELSASGTSEESIDLTAPSTADTYYYGACVDAVSEESDTTNNCSGPVRVDVTEPSPSTPDLEVGSPSVNDNSPETEGSFTLSATVRNSGDGDATATTLRYYRSAEATITRSDMQVGTDAVGELAASGTSEESIDLTAPSTAGTYYYGACVDAVSEESDTTNNCSGPVRVDVTEPPPSTPDLVVGLPSVNDSSPEMEGSFTLSATVRNSGDGDATATTLRYYRSADATITRSDRQVGTDAVGELSALGTSEESIDLTAPSTADTYYYGACVDAVSEESDTTNNCSGPVRVDVTEPPPPSTPDLVVGSPSVNDNSPETEGSFTLSATVQNSGDGESPATTLRYYRSTDATITRSDRQVGTDAVGELSASGTSEESIDLTAPSTADTYYYGACVDAVTGESSATNNCSSSVQVDVTEPPPPSNRSPEAVGEIASRTLEAGGSETLDVSSYFNDADSDELAYAAASSDTSVATAVASGSAVTVTAVASGEAVVTVTASDPGGLTAEQGIAVTVAAGNRTPIATKTIPDQTIHVWGELQTLPSSKNRFVVRGIHNYFSDPDGDPLQYEASSSDERYATVRTSIIPALDHYQILVDPVAVGQATITLTATDPEGLSANYVFGVNVSPPIPNRRPVVQWPIGARQVYVGVPDLLRFRDHFRDEDNYGSYFQLNYAVSSADNRIALVRVWDKRDHETGHGYARLVIEGVSAGETTATVVATDRAGLSVEHTFNVIARTRPPRVTRRISDVLVSAGLETYVWDLNSYFTDPDGHELVYDASSANAAVVLARVSASHPDGPYVVLSARTVGTADVTVTATDVTDLTASQTFTVTVTR